VAVTSGDEVVFAGESRKDRPVYYGAMPETGLWKISIAKFEDFVSAGLDEVNFGSSVEECVFGFEIAELGEWGRWFKETRYYVSYRPKHKQFVSVGQVEWKDVKDLSATEQLAHLGAALETFVGRISALTRKPKDFDHAALAKSIREILSRCTPTMVAA